MKYLWIVLGSAMSFFLLSSCSYMTTPAKIKENQYRRLVLIDDVIKNKTKLVYHTIGIAYGPQEQRTTKLEITKDLNGKSATKMRLFLDGIVGDVLSDSLYIMMDAEIISIPYESMSNLNKHKELVVVEEDSDYNTTIETSQYVENQWVGEVIIPDDIMDLMASAKSLMIRYYLGERPFSFWFDSLIDTDRNLDVDESDDINGNGMVEGDTTTYPNYQSNLLRLRYFQNVKTVEDYTSIVRPRTAAHAPIVWTPKDNPDDE